MKVLKNYSYNLLYQLLAIILPFITTPYVTRVFTSSDLGTYGYYSSIVGYFLLAASLGINTYATKEISGHTLDRSKVFWEIYTIQWITSGISLLLYILVCWLVPGMNNPVAYILGISLISKGLDISWLFQGVEDFKKLTIRNMLVRILGVISIFLFVRQESDLYLYVFLITFYELLGQLSMWFPARVWIHKPKITISEVNRHLLPVVTLFLPQIAISLYTILDRTLLGLYASTRDVGLYEQASKLITILLTIVTSLGSVMLPRVSHLIALKQYKAVLKLYEFSFLVYNMIIFPVIAGMLIVNDNFIQFFLGSEFQDAKYAIMIMVWNMFFIGWTNIIGIQILIPHNKHKQFMVSTTIPAFFSIACNLVLIPYLGYIGAAITSVLTESVVWFIQLYYARDIMKELTIIPHVIKVALATAVMSGILLLIRSLIKFSPFLNVIFLAFVGIIVYGAIIIIFKIVDLGEIKVKLKS
jgi:polysaccharide biosynthesis protein